MRIYKKNLVTIICTIMAATAYGQCQMDSSIVNYWDCITNKNHVIEEIRIVNNTEENYLTWVSTEPIQNKSNDFLVHQYFISKKGDYSFFDFMTLNQSFDLGTIIGFSFIKRIHPGESFSYIIPLNSDNASSYYNKIIIIRQQEVEQVLQGFQIEEKHFYPLSCIVLHNNDINDE